MPVIVELPRDLEERLRAESPNLDAEAKEVLLIELYRHGKLSHYELSEALGLDRFQTDSVLKKRNVTEDLPANEELEEDFRRLRKLAIRRRPNTLC
jgi:predicted HTH domain antitoxin